MWEETSCRRYAMLLTKRVKNIVMEHRKKRRVFEEIYFCLKINAINNTVGITRKGSLILSLHNFLI
jgi:hypothetical protein